MSLFTGIICLDPGNIVLKSSGDSNGDTLQVISVLVTLVASKHSQGHLGKDMEDTRYTHIQMHMCMHIYAHTQICTHTHTLGHESSTYRTEVN